MAGPGLATRCPTCLSRDHRIWRHTRTTRRRHQVQQQHPENCGVPSQLSRRDYRSLSYPFPPDDSLSGLRAAFSPDGDVANAQKSLVRTIALIDGARFMGKACSSRTAVSRGIASRLTVDNLRVSARSVRRSPGRAPHGCEERRGAGGLERRAADPSRDVADNCLVDMLCRFVSGGCRGP